MNDETRQEIADRHGVGDIAADLHGTTRGELEADAAARAALRMNSPGGNAQILEQLQRKSDASARLIRLLHGDGEDRA